jgi:thiamine-phosphate pyrophosphorylase
MIDKLHYISQQSKNGTHLTAIQAALSAGCKWIQLRVKDQPENLILEYAQQAQALCTEFGAKLIVNDHPEIALKAGAYGLHLGLQDMSIAEARRIVGSQMIIGGTANIFEHIQQRVAEGADYIGLGPYRFTKTKERLSPILGLDGYRDLLERVRSAGIIIPIIAIGGIESEDIAAIMQTGVHGVAISGAITHAVDAAQTTQHIYRQLHMNVLKEV